MKSAILRLALLLTVRASGYTQPGEDEDLVRARTACVLFCKLEAQRADLSAGPCLNNKVAEGWVCDVAHSPRTAQDEDPTNQCPSFGLEAKHFVEVDPDCEYIRGK